MCIAQNVQQETHDALIYRKDIAQALHKRGLLRSTYSIQISLNKRFCSIKFHTTQNMQTFFTEELTIADNNTIYFKPDYKPRQQPPTYTFISFLNVSLETEEKDRNSYARQHCTVHGVHYPHQKIDDIKYHTGTRVCRVSRIMDHFSKAEHIFGRWIRIIFDGQPDRENPTEPEDGIRET